jgi:ferrochelatase
MLTNLGTPEAPTVGAVRRYLAEFLRDPRVIELPRLLWWPILYGVILQIRPPRSAALYRRVWSTEGSPLLVNSRRQASGLAGVLAERLGRPVPVVLAMRYGRPSIRTGLEALAATDAGRVLVLPLYPQYAASTVASTFDAVAAALRRARRVPELRFVSGYHLDPGYLDALAGSLRTAGVPGRGRRLLLSYHGLPRRYVDAGDPYYAQCLETSEALAGRLGLARDQWSIAFQSRVGREEWLRPYTDELLAQWAADGLEALDVACPGFSADCLETLDEIGREARERFLARGGRELRYIGALNDDPRHLAALADLVLERTSDWR